MVVQVCGHRVAHRHGKDRYGNQRFKCVDCGRTFTEQERLFGRMNLNLDKGVVALRLLLEGNSIRSTERLTDIHRDTIVRLVVEVGESCKRFMEDRIRDVEAKDVQLDETWGFVGCKRKTAKAKGYDQSSCGDCWTYFAIERDTKLVMAFQCGKKGVSNTRSVLWRLHLATAGRFQLTTDAFGDYRMNVGEHLGDKTDYAMLTKIYGTDTGRGVDHRRPYSSAATRYSPAEIVNVTKEIIHGNPDEARICTSHVERQNLNIRMAVRRMTRLTNAFSKKWENHEAAIAIYFAYYNFCRVHSTIKTTPALASGLTNKTWSVKRLLEEMASHTT